ncbi:hypothetical protein [Synechococcus sp. GEYO]|uniref:hypothetical protein n=1 Tax=Synechococcus sp. GEYO TaxID=2575511 RepID=UPI001483B696|nr:hypothetical protein [Synechococcus sp. GEYO]
MPQLAPVALLGLRGASATALREETLEEETVSPDDGAGLRGIKQTADISQRLGLIHTCKDRRDAGITFGITAIFREWRNPDFACGGMVVRAFQPS